MTIQFTVPAVPVAQPRQRHRIVAANGRTFTQNYTPAKHPVNSFKATARMAAAGVLVSPFTGPVAMTAVFVMPRTKGQIWKTKPMPRLPYSKPKNDWDNLGKSLCDALTGLVWNDDGQLCDVRVERWIAAGDESPHVEVIVTEIEA